jgi:predicted TIM-barrel fold metal-dependent hydrolase
MAVKANILRDSIASVPFVDTHSHVAGGDEGSPVDDRGGRSLPQVLMSDHLRYLLEAQDPTLPLADYRDWTPDDADANMALVLPLLDRVRHLTAYAAVREGIRELHPFAEPDITEGNWGAINDQILSAYRTHGERAWQRRVAARANVPLMNQMVVLPYVTDHWADLSPDERARQRRWLLPSLILDGYLFTGFAAQQRSLGRSLEILGALPRTHGDYVSFFDAVLQRFVAEGGKSVKLMTAYFRPLRFDRVPDMEAERLFARGPTNLRGEGLDRLQNNLFWHLLEMLRRRNLPLIVHTGYSTPPEWADPRHLLPVLTDFPEVKVDLCHSGWPNHGTALVFARQFRNCYFNLAWTPLLSRALGRRMLSEAIDMLPANKILIGTDTGTAEAFLGTVRLTRSLLADVLEEKVREGQFDAQVAMRVAKAILLDNPLEFYGISPKDVPNESDFTPSPGTPGEGWGGGLLRA